MEVKYYNKGIKIIYSFLALFALVISIVSLAVVDGIISILPLCFFLPLCIDALKIKYVVLKDESLEVRMYFNSKWMREIGLSDILRVSYNRFLGRISIYLASENGVEQEDYTISLSLEQQSDMRRKFLYKGVLMD
ncbi:MAG: hypothetical protein II991_07405 [Bacteroidales bacterium]|nr:hypothetical protein [Bacteroidales bacterium]